MIAEVEKVENVEGKLCPFTNYLCRKEKCAIYDGVEGECAILVIATAVKLGVDT